MEAKYWQEWYSTDCLKTKEIAEPISKPIGSVINQSELEAKTRNRCQARENMKTVPNAGKHVTGARHLEKRSGLDDYFTY